MSGKGIRKTAPVCAMVARASQVSLDNNEGATTIRGMLTIRGGTPVSNRQ